LQLIKKIGRPTNNPKIREVKARLDEETYQILLSYCRKTGISISEGIRESIKRLESETAKENRKGLISMNKFEEEFNEEWEKYQEQKKKELYPNVMLIGASGAGKSSLINKIFGGNFASISDVKPETKGYGKIFWGKEYGNTVNLIDTAGYELGQGDTYYNEISKTISNGINGELVHIIWYCIPITNERIQEMDITILRQLLNERNVRKRICIVFTKCDQDSEDSSKAKALKKALKSNIDFPMNYFETSKDLDLDLQKLIKWSAHAIDNQDLRNKFIAAQMIDLNAKHVIAKKIIGAATVAAGGVGAIPIPFPDAVLLLPIQVGMMGEIIDIYGISNLANISKAIISDTIITTIGKSLASNILKIIPVFGQLVGSVVNAGVASALTYAIGFATSEICYSNVKKFLDGQPVVWDQIFATDEFTNLVKETFRNENKNFN